MSSLYDFDFSAEEEVKAQPAASQDVTEQDDRFGDDDKPPFALTHDFAGSIYSDKEIIDEAFRWFREHGFPYRSIPKFVMMQQMNQIASTKEESLANSSEAYSVADTFNPHRMHATVLGKVSPLQCFHDDKKFRHALALRLERNGSIPAGFFGEITLSLGTQQCSNFRPGFAAWLYRQYCPPNGVVLDTSTGYGGRLVGFIVSRVGGTYIGIDPNEKTHNGNVKMAEALGVSSRVQLHNVPVEDFDVSQIRGTCDFAFTSPPYFSKEHYDDAPTQSWVRYGESFEKWVEGFLRPMLRVTYEALKRRTIAIVNIEDVKIKTKRYPLVDRTIEVAKEVGFSHRDTQLFKMVARLGANQDEEPAAERVLVFGRR